MLIVGERKKTEKKQKQGKPKVYFAVCVECFDKISKIVLEVFFFYYNNNVNQLKSLRVLRRVHAE